MINKEHNIVSFNEGGMWEEKGFEIKLDCEIKDESTKENICRHCHTITEKEKTLNNGKKYKLYSWICPRVVIAYNESGYNSTGVCLDCIIEAEKTLRNN